jgi:ATP-dependent Clp protease ATP-binding subunit ClpB
VVHHAPRRWFTALHPGGSLRSSCSLAWSTSLPTPLNHTRALSLRRFLPDKAIDLMDEAASRLRMQQESKPDALEALDRSIIRKKMELQALRRETDSKSVKRREQVEEELRAAEAESKQLGERWQKERLLLSDRKRAKAQLEECRADAERAQRQGNFDEAARLLYEEIPRLERLNASPTGDEDGKRPASDSEIPLLSDSVTAEHIARVVSRATGIPLQNLMQGERERLLNMEATLGERVVGQPEALSAISNTVRVARAGLHPHNRPIGTFLFIGPSGVGKVGKCISLCVVYVCVYSYM